MDSFENIGQNAKWPPLFDLLTPFEHEKITTKHLKVDFKAEEIIRKQGAPLTHVIIFLSGLAKLYIEGNLKGNIILRLIKPENIIAGPGIYYDLRHHYSIKALTELQTVFIDVGLFKELINDNVKFRFAFNRELSKNTLVTYERLVNLTQKQMPGRMADVLIYLSDEIYNNKTFNNILSKNDMVELAGMSKDNVRRVLKNFTQMGLIKMNKQEIEIIKTESLLALSNKGHY